MLDVLKSAEEALPRLLLETTGWKSLRINYHPPFVDRVFRDWGKGRLYLHRIYPCAPEDALFHPHGWPSAMRVLEGRYEMGIGWGEGDSCPPMAARLVVSGDMTYEMTDRHAWHYVRPIGGPALTVMVAGQPWERSTPRSTRPLEPLTDPEVEALIAQVSRYYPG